MKPDVVNRLNGFGVVLRFITPLLAALTTVGMFILAAQHTDIRELRKDIKEITSNLVFKCDYIDDRRDLVHCVERLDDRLRKLEMDGRVSP